MSPKKKISRQEADWPMTDGCKPRLIHRRLCLRRRRIRRAWNVPLCRKSRRTCRNACSPSNRQRNQTWRNWKPEPEAPLQPPKQPFRSWRGAGADVGDEYRQLLLFFKINKNGWLVVYDKTQKRADSFVTGRSWFFVCRRVIGILQGQCEHSSVAC